jgi:photosystem II stability/assembly factor-like uncharacterized protein
MNRLLRALPTILLLAACSGLPGPTPSPAQTPAVGLSSGERTPAAPPSAESTGEPQPAVDILAAGRIDADHGWALTASYLLLTDDAGTTWRSSEVPGPRTTRGVLGVLFADPDHGWLATLDSNDPTAAFFDIWRTTDGAETWTRARVREGANRSDAMGWVAFVALPGGRVFAFVEGGMPDGYTGDLYASTDGGASWGADRVASDGGVTGPIAFADPDHAVVSGGAPGSRLFSTADGGRTWRRAAIPPLSGTVLDDTQLWAPARFWDPRSGAVAATYGTDEGATTLAALVTSDGGATWSIASAQPLRPGASNAVPMVFLDPSHWLAQMGPATVVSTEDAGATWSATDSIGLPATPDSLLMADRDRGWALVEQNGCLAFKSNCFNLTTLFGTNDGGATWAALSPRVQP